MIIWILYLDLPDLCLLFSEKELARVSYQVLGVLGRVYDVSLQGKKMFVGMVLCLSNDQDVFALACSKR